MDLNRRQFLTIGGSTAAVAATGSGITTRFWGLDDDVLPVHSREFFRRALPDHARFETAAGFGHAPFMDHPELFLDRVETFANRVMANRAAATRGG